MIGFYDYTVIATYLATALGVGGIFLAADGLHLPAVFCLLLAGLLDTFDGRIARTKKDRSEQQKHFGIQIDSLNDLICFGVLPAMICRGAYAASPAYLSLGGPVGRILPPVWFDAALCFFVLAGLIRLGYFNVTEEERQEGTSAARKYYLGLPITSSTLMIPLVYLLSVLLPGASTAILTLGVLVTGLLFIAPIHVKKPGLPALCALALIGAAELAGLIMLAL